MRADNMAEALSQKYEALRAELDERTRRLWAASEAMGLGPGGVAAVAQATGLAESTIRCGRRELRQAAVPAARRAGSRRVRQPGGGRKPVPEQAPAVVTALAGLVEPAPRGDPRSPLRGTCKSTRQLAEELTGQGHPVSRPTVAQGLEAWGYSLQGTRKTQAGRAHPDRNAQFAHINPQVKAFQPRGQPVVSGDAQKKELGGELANAGREYPPQGQPERVGVYDCVDKELGKAHPYGGYDLTAHEGWVSVGTDHDTAQFAVETLRRWWPHRGYAAYPKAQAILITAEGGGSHGSRSRLWKRELQRLADETGLALPVCHCPPGTSKWHKIEPRMFCHLTENWRGRPVISPEVIVNLIANATTATGLRRRAALDTKAYPTGLKVSPQQMQELRLQPASFHGKDGNYTRTPRGTENR